MEKHEIIEWRDRHNKEYASGIEVEQNVGDRLRVTKELSKDDLNKIIEWKFDTDGRIRTRELNLVSTVDEHVLKKVSNEVFNLKVEQDKERIERLCEFSGIGVAVASVILTFFDPENYCVFDFHVWQEVFGGRPAYTIENYTLLLSKLREEAKIHGIKVRDVEKAYFKRNYDKKERALSLV